MPNLDLALQDTDGSSDRGFFEALMESCFCRVMCVPCEMADAMSAPAPMMGQAAPSFYAPNKGSRRKA